MAILHFLVKRSGVVLVVAILITGGSIAYAMIRSTTELPGTFVAVEASYGLAILTGDGQPLAALEFGEVVQGDRALRSFAVRNDSNTPVKLGFRVRTGDGTAVAIEPSGRCALSGPAGGPRSQTGLKKEVAQKLRERHHILHEQLGTIDTPAKREQHEKFHQELAQAIRKRVGDQGNSRPPQLVGQRVGVPGTATFCFVVPHRDRDRPAILPPGGLARVAVELRAHPDVPLGLQQVTFLVDAHDLFE